MRTLPLMPPRSQSHLCCARVITQRLCAPPAVCIMPGCSSGKPKVKTSMGASGEVPAWEGVIRLIDEARADGLLVGVHGNRTGAVRSNDDNMARSDESVLRLVPMPHLAWV